jgi:hypothetical protein
LLKNTPGEINRAGRTILTVKNASPGHFTIDGRLETQAGQFQLGGRVNDRPNFFCGTLPDTATSNRKDQRKGNNHNCYSPENSVKLMTDEHCSDENRTFDKL